MNVTSPVIFLLYFLKMNFSLDFKYFSIIFFNVFLFCVLFSQEKGDEKKLAMFKKLFSELLQFLAKEANYKKSIESAENDFNKINIGKNHSLLNDLQEKKSFLKLSFFKAHYINDQFFISALEMLFYWENSKNNDKEVVPIAFDKFLEQYKAFFKIAKIFAKKDYYKKNHNKNNTEIMDKKIKSMTKDNIDQILHMFNSNKIADILKF